MADDFLSLLTDQEKRDYKLMLKNVELERANGIIDPATGDAPSMMDLHLWAIHIRARES